MIERNYNDTHLGSHNRVSVGTEFKGKCEFRGKSIKRCKCKIVARVFVDDGRPMMSRYWGAYCRKHLPKAIQEGWNHNNKAWEKSKRIQNKEKKEVENKIINKFLKKKKK